MPRPQACLRGRGHEKAHNAASVEGRYRGQYQPTSRTANLCAAEVGNPSRRACSGEEGMKKAHNAASVEGRYRGQPYRCPGPRGASLAIGVFMIFTLKTRFGTS